MEMWENSYPPSCHDGLSECESRLLRYLGLPGWIGCYTGKDHMYFVNSKRRLELVLLKEISKLFGSSARVTLNNNKININIHDGDGVDQPLHGKKFRLSIEELTGDSGKTS